MILGCSDTVNYVSPGAVFMYLLYLLMTKIYKNGCITNCSSCRPLLIVASHINRKSRIASPLLIDFSISLPRT